jgi:hypothetical protein
MMCFNVLFIIIHQALQKELGFVENIVWFAMEAGPVTMPQVFV